MAAQVVVLGLLFVALAVVSDSAYAVAAGSVGERLRRSESVHRWLDRVSGGVYILLGAAARLSGERPGLSRGEPLQKLHGVRPQSVERTTCIPASAKRRKAASASSV